MIGSLIIEGLKDALPLIEKFAPTLNSIIRYAPHIAHTIALPLLAKYFGSESGDLSGLALSDKAQSILEAFENQHGKFFKDFLNEIRPLISAKLNVELHWEGSK